MTGNKNTFWQAFIIALIIFWVGILIGISFEKSRTDSIKKVYFDSETDIFDFELASEIVYNSNITCSQILDKSVFFADKIYDEAVKLEKYDNSNKITEELISLHRRYDFLRTLLWKDIISNEEKCGEKINTVIYLYRYKDPSVTDRAIQGTMSNFLTDLKTKYENRIILIPIGADTNIESLNILREKYGLDKYPVIFVNEEYQFETLESLKDVEKYLN